VALGAFALAAVPSLLSSDVAGARIEEWAQGHRVMGIALLGLFLVGKLAGAKAGQERGSAAAGSGSGSG
jgi:hypothetical protein